MGFNVDRMLAATVLFSGSLACSGPKPPEIGPPVGAKIVDCGEIEAGASIGMQAAPQTGLGAVHVMHELETPRFKPGCPNITARVGARFGIEVLVEGGAGRSVIPLRTRVTHPAIRNPDNGRTSTVESWDSPMNVGIPRYAGWSFDEPWELVPGAWRIEILEGERVIATQDFQVSAGR